MLIGKYPARGDAMALLLATKVISGGGFIEVFLYLKVSGNVVTSTNDFQIFLKEAVLRRSAQEIDFTNRATRALVSKHGSCK